MNVYIWIAVGVIIGSIVSNILFLITTRASGILKIDQTNPEKDLYSIEILDDLDKLPRKRRIVLKIKSVKDTSQK